LPLPLFYNKSALSPDFSSFMISYPRG